MIIETMAAGIFGLAAAGRYLVGRPAEKQFGFNPPTTTPLTNTVGQKPVDPIPFKDGEPTTFGTFNAQSTAVGLLEDAIGALEPHEMAIRPQMMAGSAGGGKTLLAKIVASELRKRNGVTSFIEAMDVNTEEGLDTIMREVVRNPGSVVFFDEIHVMAGYKHLIKLYLALDEGRYHFKGEMAPVKLPPTTFISATTNCGDLPEAFKRRWVIHFFEPYTEAQLLRVILTRGVPIYEEAARLILSRTGFTGAPWETVQILDLANNSRKRRKGKKVNVKDVKRVFRLYQIDQNGLRRIDRNAIEALFKLIKRKVNGEMRYAGSEENVALMAKIDREEFRASVRPRLISRGLLELRPWWGHCLTDRAVEMYAHLRQSPPGA